jgi:ADP-ribose pyrophosphatase YjhB (NUDIX family)
MERRLNDEERAQLTSLGRGPDGRSTDVPSGGGPPGWIADMLRFCSRCGAALELTALPEESRDRLACTACGLVAYINPRLVVTTLPITDDGEAMLIRRGIEPGRGLWAPPGGFLEVDETVSEGAARETLEETGLLVVPGRIIGLYSRLEAGVVTLTLEARIVGGEPMLTPEALEIRAFAPNAIPWHEIAFRTSWYALADWVVERDPTVPVPEAFPGHTPF